MDIDQAVQGIEALLGSDQAMDAFSFATPDIPEELWGTDLQHQIEALVRSFVLQEVADRAR